MNATNESPTFTGRLTGAVAITPTIGRRVWYWPSTYDLNEMNRSVSDQPFDAGVCCVWSDHLVNLTIADHDGRMHRRTSVRLLQGDEEARPGEPHATWMPYQKQAVEAPRRLLTEADAAADLAGTERPVPTWIKSDGTTVQSAVTPGA